MKTKDIHIGQLIKAVVRDKKIRDVDLANKIGKSRQNIYDMYKRPDMEVKLLLTVSVAIDHNFFEDIYPSKKSFDDSVDKVFEILKEFVKEKHSHITSSEVTAIDQNRSKQKSNGKIE